MFSFVQMTRCVVSEAKIAAPREVIVPVGSVQILDWMYMPQMIHCIQITQKLKWNGPTMRMSTLEFRMS